MTEEKVKKEQLLSRLLDGVKGCQSRFGSRTELATEDDESVTKLCLAFEDVFLHGVKNHQQNEKSKSLWQMTESFVPSSLRLTTETVSFWPIVKTQLSKHEIDRFLLLHHVRSDFGRARAWLRASLNEHSLERYILMLLSLDNLQNYYEIWSFLRDPELSAILPQTAAGLGSVLFALVVDNSSLDNSIRTTGKAKVAEAHVASPVEVAEVADQFLSAMATTSVSRTTILDTLSGGQEGVSSASKDNSSQQQHLIKKRKKKTPINVVSFDDEDTGGSPSPSFPIPYPSPSVIINSPTPTSPQTKSHKRKGEFELDSPHNTDNPHSLHQTITRKDKTSSQRIPIESDCRTNSGQVDETPVQITKLRDINNIRNCKDDRFVDDYDNERSLVPPEISIYSSSVKSVDCISINSIYSDCSERLDFDNLSLTGMEISPSQRLKPVRDRGNGGSSGGNGDSENDPDSASHDLIPVPNFDSSVAPELDLDLENNSMDCSRDLEITSPATPMSCCSEATLTLSRAERGSRRNSKSSTKSLKSLALEEDIPPPRNTVKIKNNVDEVFVGRIGKNLSDTTAATATNVSDFLDDGNEENEERIQKLKSILDREIETVTRLQAHLAEEKRKSTDQIKIFEAKIESLSKENEILKHQLNKYVGAVQMLKKEGSLARKTSSFDQDDDTLITQNCLPDEATEYERKLIQVAEMHGELMEFNAHLQTSLRKRDTIIRRLREELVDLRGPLAAPLITGDEDLDDESWDIVDSSSNDSRSRSGTIRRNTSANERVLINIWIPSAFLTGAATDLHHVYQVFVRIKDTEWNVYRRYSQFYSLHRDLKKRESVIGTFYFPPKKHLGNKDGKFVDERRRKLQEYLRKVMNHTLQTNSILAAHPDKNLLISIFPFFGESSFMHNSSSQKPKRERSRSRNLFFLPSSHQNTAQHSSGFLQSQDSSQYPQYTGL